ncbi:CvpA family protein [Spiribacter salinus]|uniref:CvpA family protein n=1 Tax=Spiribacter salinus TaxID=1335746 RepID=UPI001C956A39|nr:CvpA family protein [Spiribacter salinus]MBY5268970.1 colicin V production protein [Spiribacter salinus]
MNWLDYTLLGVIGISVLIGVIRGFVREVISVVSWVAAFMVAVRYSGTGAEELAPWIDSPMLRTVIAFAALFIATLLVGALIGYIARGLVGRTGLSGTDRLLGIVFGGVRGSLLVGLMILAAGLTALPEEAWWQDSVIADAYQPWVCRQQIGGWLGAAEAYEPLTQAPMNGSAAFAYWEAFCGHGETTDNGKG